MIDQTIKAPPKERLKGARRPHVKLCVSIIPTYADTNDQDMMAVTVVVGDTEPSVLMPPMPATMDSAVDAAFRLAVDLLKSGTVIDTDTLRVMIQRPEGCPPTVEQMTVAEARDIQISEEASDWLGRIVHPNL